MWRETIPGDRETTLRISVDGTWSAVDADFILRECTTSTGIWSVDEPGIVTAQNTHENGLPVDEPVDETPFSVRDGVLTLSHPGEDVEVFVRFDGSMPTCGDYPIPSWEMRATIDGVEYDFSEVPLFERGELEAALEVGQALFDGWGGAPAGETTECETCRVIELNLQDYSGTLSTGSYETAYHSPSGTKIASVTYWPALFSSDVHYRSDESDPAAQPWSGSVTVTSATAELFEGTFELVLFHGRAPGPPQPTVTVTNGYFRYENR